MKPRKGAISSGFPKLLEEVKSRIRQAQIRSVLSVNAELTRLDWDIGRLIDARQQTAGYGAGVIPRLARKLRSDLPGLQGFSERNIKLMVPFAREYPDAFPADDQKGQPAVAPSGRSRKGQPAVAQLGSDEKRQPPLAQLAGTQKGQPAVAQLPVDPKALPLVAQIPWAHNVLLLQRVKNKEDRYWSMQQTLTNGWSRSVLGQMIDLAAHRRQGQAVSNFHRLLPPPRSDLAQQSLKDPYIFDFLTLQQPFHERELEAALIRHLQEFLLELGQGFALVGRQYRIALGDSEYFIDLLFYHLKLRAYIVIDLKAGPFLPEYAGKLNFYCNVVNDRLRHPDDAPTIGLILCQGKDRLVAEYALSGIDKPIGVSTYQLTRALPRSLQSALPTVEELEAELAESIPRRALNRRRSRGVVPSKGAATYPPPTIARRASIQNRTRKR
jgi:predicted nuclease of restriction endonuclease-like (RecB) superfamily